MIPKIRKEALKHIGQVMTLNEDRCRQLIIKDGGRLDYKLLYQNFRDACTNGEIIIVEEDKN